MVTETAVNGLREDVLRPHILYLEKFEALSQGEREAFVTYFRFLSSPRIEIHETCDPLKFHNLMNVKEGLA